MNYWEEDLDEKKKPKQNQEQLLLLLLFAGAGYYFFIYYKRNQAITEIKTMLQNNPTVTIDKLDANLWTGKESWEEYLNNCYFTSQINLFAEEMKKAIKEKSKNKPQTLQEQRKETIENIKEYAKKEIELTPSFEKEIKNFYKKINSAIEIDISFIKEEAINCVTQQQIKRQKLHWLREPKNWADKKINLIQTDFEGAWEQFCSKVNPTQNSNKEPKKCVFGASYEIKFPPSLWNNLSEEQKKHEKAKELTLDEKVESYTFNPKVDNWYDKAIINPVRGDRDRDKKDNNATLYGAPRTGKSIIVEKLAYEADIYPLVVIQGSALTPTINDQQCSIKNFNKFIYTICDINNTLVDDFGLEINPESGEPQYILFIDEANQVSENTMLSCPSRLTFLKECMGSDNWKANESHNLWIIATNHLSQIDEAVYQPGRLTNQLSFSWTLGKFKEYATDAHIYDDFPEHWKNNNSLSEEDNKWVNRFNVIHFEESFLGRTIKGDNIPNGICFWDMFIKNEENQKILNEEKEDKVIDETTGETEEVIKQKGIPLGEFLQFFWQKFDSGELWDKDFDAKFTNPREPKMTDAVAQASNYIGTLIDVRLKALNEQCNTLITEIQSANGEFQNLFTAHSQEIEKLTSEK